MFITAFLRTTETYDAEHDNQYPIMSSAEDDYDVENSLAIVQDSKKRRVQRACDTCRRKKSQSFDKESL